MSNWRVWRASIEDQETLVQLERHAFGARSWGADAVKASFDAAGVSVLFGGRADDIPSGFVMWRDLGEEAELLTIGVSPASRGAGLGAAMLQSVLAAARKGGAHKIYLEVDRQNPAALRLYQKAGFANVGQRKAYYRDGGDASVMACGL
ncbi:GNAT family N-acetyltransferase [Hyphococcus flavus]|uniref:GNAT family N-acetyltransferase n=1 Tax=Hyphococcus flavus TaxID=1866326 RepID=A0AAE9ZF76_9PROT|nr:GNAT family N-acetyltransferase [Hyphococcus flavus]WDI32675.1 GNAT family N-acetyltransferase [Hyphococcus flavus]